MKIHDIVDFLRSDMRLLVKMTSKGDDRPFAIYDGEVQDMPYWVAALHFRAGECIEADGNALVIDISPPARKPGPKPANTNQAALDALSEEEVLLHLAGLLYHYDVGTIHDERFDEDEWKKVFSPMIDYVEKRAGSIAFDERMRAWFKARSGAFQNGNDHGTTSKTETVGEDAKIAFDERVNALVEALEAIEQSGTGTLDGSVVLTTEARLAREELGKLSKRLSLSMDANPGAQLNLAAKEAAKCGCPYDADKPAALEFCMDNCDGDDERPEKCWREYWRRQAGGSGGDGQEI